MGQTVISGLVFIAASLENNFFNYTKYAEKYTQLCGLSKMFVDLNNKISVTALKFSFVQDPFIILWSKVLYMKIKVKIPYGTDLIYEASRKCLCN